MSINLHWFRSDLRVYDNPALAAAQARGPVVAIYIATAEQWQLHDDAPIKQDYWRRNLQLLEQQLRTLGIALQFFAVPQYRDIPALLASLLPAWQVKTLHCNREYPLNEQRRDQQVLRVCTQYGVSMQLHEGQVLLAPERVLNKSGQPYKVFTPFSRAMREQLHADGLQLAATIKKQQAPELAPLPQQIALHEIAWPQPEAHWEQLWPAGETSALARLDQFCEHNITHYKQQRDIPAVDGTSMLSPALAAGVVSVRECWNRAQQGQEGQGVLTWQNELLWRDFYKHIMAHYPHVCRKLPWRSDLGHIPWRHDEQEFARWCQGQTGIPVIDAAMRQLLQTGWMHNRLRMITAMFLSKHLLLDWRWGERWFMQHLVDGDFAANNGGWQWSASTGTDAVPYFRIFNPVTQSQRFDREGEFIRRYVPELNGLNNRDIHAAGPLRPAGYPQAMLELKLGRERALNAFRRP